ncbi:MULTISPECIES: heavy-metal-associated domain-containing protein [Streptomycetaceae]|uniref:Copper ion binding protein, putative n=1 Tax=Streptantibioticus cattleyicolor (strain ATCC 35852 / DSM 46488 / JCM 4925 / NBRC 14057 / NRRL 8057) TaxID=1003195 RepID=F8K1M8_STREN|nr:MULTISPECIES: copper ion binding protein [Streptomycetaceae]AEW95099.1 copper ion binding protein, putative [Streptantibioticus cattleyicolor NRRL 8057 = DSM 46488]MYS59689.1 copper ion binding protein [Streptomyces sp. SID5468]CCB75445.1 copper insertion chaperone and transporter component [Streptantibioticus cattleyicolor NRRL 8057 = DSM 46488]
MSDVITLSVPGISCAKCQQAIEGAVGALPGVSAVSVDIPAKSVTVTFDAPAGRPSIDAAINDAGYEVAGVVEANAS